MGKLKLELSSSKTNEFLFNYLNRIILRITETLGIEILKVRTLTTAEKIKINGRAAAVKLA